MSNRSLQLIKTKYFATALLYHWDYFQRDECILVTRQRIALVENSFCFVVRLAYTEAIAGALSSPSRVLPGPLHIPIFLCLSISTVAAKP